MPTLKAAGNPVGTVRSMGEHAFVGAAVDRYTAVWILKTIGDVKHIAGIHLAPYDAGYIATSRQQSNTRLVILIPSVREVESLSECGQGNRYRQIKNNNVILGQATLVYRRPVLNGDGAL